MNMEAPPPVGHNRPPPFDPDEVAALKAKVSQFADAAAEWKKAGVTTDEEAAELNDFLAGSRKLFKQVDEARVAAKKPHDDAGKAVQAAFTPILDALERAGKIAKAILTDFAKEKAAKLERERQEKEAAARAAQEEADRLAAQAEARDDIMGQIDAEAAKAEADRLAKEAAKPVKASVGSASGGGRTAALRKTTKARIVNLSQAFMHYRDRPEVSELLVRLANADLRGMEVKTAPPGFETYDEESVA